MLKKNKLVSVIIPTYNRREFLEETILSAVKQTYIEIEILVIDDGSTDNYAESICKKFDNCKYYYKKNGGVSSARNYGIEKANGSFIAFLDDDDLWKENKIELQVNLLNKNRTVSCIHSAAMVINEKGVSTGKIIGASKLKAHKRSGYVFWNALSVWLVKAPTPLIRKSVFKTDMMFDETLKAGEDADFYQRLFYRHTVLYLSEPLAYYREYDDSRRLSLNKEFYLGIEKNMYYNLKNLGIKNPLILYRIAVRLVFSVNRKYNEFSDKNSFFFTLSLYLRPLYYLKKVKK